MAVALVSTNVMEKEFWAFFPHTLRVHMKTNNKDNTAWKKTILFRSASQTTLYCFGLSAFLKLKFKDNFNFFFFLFINK